MNIGFYTAYGPNEHTYLILQLANWFEILGNKCSIFSLGPKTSTDLIWDNRVKYGNDELLIGWLESLDLIIFSGEINSGVVVYSTKLEAKLIYIASWFDTPIQKMHYRFYNHIICLSPSLAHKLRDDFGFKNISYIPIDLPLTNEHESLTLHTDKPKIVVNVRCYRRPTSNLRSLLSRLVRNNQANWLFLARSNQNHHKSWLHKALKLANLNSSITIETSSDWIAQQSAYFNADLTLIPSIIQQRYGLNVVLSMVMGVPVATFDIPPANEYISKETGILAPCQISYTDMGDAKITPDIERFELAINKLLKQKNTISKFKKHLSAAFTERRKIFKDRWLQLLKG